MKNQNDLYKSIAILFIIVIGSVIVIRGCTKGETLYDYANKQNIPIHVEEQK